MSTFLKLLPSATLNLELGGIISSLNDPCKVQIVILIMVANYGYVLSLYTKCNTRKNKNHVKLDFSTPI